MSRKQDKGGQILAAAYKVFGDKGYFAAKMADIAYEAGVAKGTLYLYYVNKEELFHAVVETILQDYIQTYEHILSKPIPFTDKLTSLVRHHLLFIRDRHDFAKLNIEEAPINEKLCEKMSSIMDTASTLFIQAIQEAYPTILDEKKAYLSYLCFSRMGDGMIGDTYYTNRRLTDEMVEERARFVANLFVHGLSHIPSDSSLVEQGRCCT